MDSFAHATDAAPNPGARVTPPRGLTPPFAPWAMSPLRAFVPSAFGQESVECPFARSSTGDTGGHQVYTPWGLASRGGNVTTDLAGGRDRARALAGPIAMLVGEGGRRALPRIVLPLLVVAVGAWTLTVRMGSGDMSMTAPAFAAGWIVMMVAMMLPAAAPVVGIYALAARRGVAAAIPVFIAGYLAVWALSAVPAYAVSRAIDDPLVSGRPWVSRLLGGALLAAAAYQLTPLKAACLRHCRSPMSFFLDRRGSLARPRTAFGAGAGHGLYCLGCCWALMALLVLVGGMQLAWALGLAAVITVEKLGPGGATVSRVVAVGAAGLGTALLWRPGLLAHLVVVHMSVSSM